jgi:hypothetical protein
MGRRHCGLLLDGSNQVNHQSCRLNLESGYEDHFVCPQDGLEAADLAIQNIPAVF